MKDVTARSTVYRHETRELGVGERIQLTQADKSQGIRSGEYATVERIAEGGALTVQRDNGKTVTLDPDQAKHIRVWIHGGWLETHPGRPCPCKPARPWNQRPLPPFRPTCVTSACTL